MQPRVTAADRFHSAVASRDQNTLPYSPRPQLTTRDGSARDCDRDRGTSRLPARPQLWPPGPTSDKHHLPGGNSTQEPAGPCVPGDRAKAGVGQ